MTKPKIQIILGSTRGARQGEKVAKWIYNEAKKREDFDVELVDLRDWELPFFDESVSPGYNQGKYENPKAAEWAAKVGEADGYIFVSPEYNHSFPAVLKNAIDYVYPEWNKKAGGLVTYSVGPWGGVRAAQQLRQVLVEIQMVPIRNAVHIPFVDKAFDDAGNVVNEHTAHLAPTFFDQLVWWVNALKVAREA